MKHLISEFKFEKIHLIVIVVFAILVQLSTIVSDRYLFVFDEQPEKSIPGVVWYIDKKDKDVEIDSTVAFYPKDIPSYFKDYNLIKYVKGSSGDVVSIKDGSVFVNEKKLTEVHPKVVEKFNLSVVDKTYILKTGEYFMYGTHPRSFDSRYFGPVNVDQFIGEGFAIY